MDHSRIAYLMGPKGEPIAMLPVEKDAAAVAAAGHLGEMGEARPFWESRSTASARRNGKRCATAAANAACTRWRMRTPATSIPPMSPASCWTCAAANAPITRTAAPGARLHPPDAEERAAIELAARHCAYRLRAGLPLPAWHYLISGDRDAVHRRAPAWWARPSAKRWPGRCTTYRLARRDGAVDIIEEDE
jgi:hypothetical protein